MRLVRAVLVVATCLGLAWLIVKTSAVDALVRMNPAAAAMVAPQDPRVVMANAMVEFTMTGGSVGLQTRTATIDALKQAPLAEEPFLLSATQALAEKKTELADRLLREARRRNPRSRMTLLLLLDRQLRKGEVEEAVITMNVLGRLIPQAESVLTGQLAQFAKAPASRPAIKRVLAQAPDVRAGLLEHLASNGGDPDLILEIAGPGAAPSKGAPPDWQRKLVSSLVERGNVEQAFALWKRFSGIASTEGYIYDPGFKGLPGFPPFNWHFPESTGGVAEASPGIGLQVQYYGRDQAQLVEQTLLLPPGRYRLSMNVAGNVSPEGGTVSFNITCTNPGSTLLVLPLTTQGQGQKTASGEFSVPAGCRSQKLALVGSPAEFAKESNFTVSALTLNKTG